MKSKKSYYGETKRKRKGDIKQILREEKEKHKAENYRRYIAYLEKQEEEYL